jgi:hypothetical protein
MVVATRPTIFQYNHNFSTSPSQAKIFQILPSLIGKLLNSRHSAKWQIYNQHGYLSSAGPYRPLTVPVEQPQRIDHTLRLLLVQTEIAEANGLLPLNRLMQAIPVTQIMTNRHFGQGAQACASWIDTMWRQHRAYFAQQRAGRIGQCIAAGSREHFHGKHQDNDLVPTQA